MTDTSLLARIQERLDILKLTERAASHKTGRGPDVIRNIRRSVEQGKTYNPRSDTLQLLASVLDTTPEWLLGGSAPVSMPEELPATIEETPPNYRPPPTFFGPRDLKVFAAVEGGTGELVVDTDPIDIVVRPWYLEHVPDGFAVLVTGESMVPAFRPGDLAIVNPRLPALKSEDHIFVSGDMRGEFKATIKHLVRQTRASWRVRQFNPPEGMPEEFDLARDEWGRALRVVGSYRR